MYNYNNTSSMLLTTSFYIHTHTVDKVWAIKFVHENTNYYIVTIRESC